MILIAGVLLVALAIWFVIAGNRRYPGHAASEWMTVGQRVFIGFVLVASLLILVAAW